VWVDEWTQSAMRGVRRLRNTYDILEGIVAVGSMVLAAFFVAWLII